MKQKIDFLRTKISPEDLEEVVKRYNSEPKDAAQPTQDPALQPVTNALVPAAPAPLASESSWKSYAAIGAVGAAILGAAGTTLYMVNLTQNSQKETRRSKKRPPPSRDSYSDYHERDNVASRDLPHPTLHALVKQQEKTEETVQRLAKQIESLVTVLKPKEENPLPKPASEAVNPPPLVQVFEEVKQPNIDVEEVLLKFLAAAPSDADRSQAIKSLKVSDT